MSHKHFCDFAGHAWECEGTALRPLAGDTEPSICICGTCQIPMEEGNHTKCMIELLACPQHRDEQLRAMQENRFDNSKQVLVCPEDNVCLGCGRPMNTHDYQRCMATSSPKAPTTIQYEPPSPTLHCDCGCAVADPDDAVAWCLWCDHVYVEYTAETEDKHFAHHCPNAPQGLKKSATKKLAEGKSRAAEYDHGN